MQIKFDEVEYYGQVLHISKTCQDCKNECKIKSVCESIEIFCKRYKSLHIFVAKRATAIQSI